MIIHGSQDGDLTIGLGDDCGHTFRAQEYGAAKSAKVGFRVVLPIHHICAGDMSKVTLFSLQITGCNVIEVIPPLPIKSKVGVGNVRAFVLADQVVNGTGWIVEGMSGRLGPKKPSKGTDQADKNKDWNWFRLHFIFLFYIFKSFAFAEYPGPSPFLFSGKERHSLGT